MPAANTAPAKRGPGGLDRVPSWPRMRPRHRSNQARPRPAPQGPAAGAGVSGPSPCRPGARQAAQEGRTGGETATRECRRLPAHAGQADQTGQQRAARRAPPVPQRRGTTARARSWAQPAAPVRHPRWVMVEAGFKRSPLEVRVGGPPAPCPLPPQAAFFLPPSRHRQPLSPDVGRVGARKRPLEAEVDRGQEPRRTPQRSV